MGGDSYDSALETLMNEWFITVLQMIGLSLSQTLDDLALLYLATVQALAVSLLCFICLRVSNDFLWVSVWHPSTFWCKWQLLLFTCKLIPLASSSLVSAWYASYSGRDERSRTWHQNPLPLWRVEQKRPVRTDSCQRYRYTILTTDGCNDGLISPKNEIMLTGSLKFLINHTHCYETPLFNSISRGGQFNFFHYCSFSGLPVVLPDQMEAVLIGAAVLGACASQDYSSIQVEWHTYGM